MMSEQGIKALTSATDPAAMAEMLTGGAGGTSGASSNPLAKTGPTKPKVSAAKPKAAKPAAAATAPALSQAERIKASIRRQMEANKAADGVLPSKPDAKKPGGSKVVNAPPASNTKKPKPAAPSTPKKERPIAPEPTLSHQDALLEMGKVTREFPCGCGCAEMVKAPRFRPGHDSGLTSRIMWGKDQVVERTIKIMVGKVGLDPEVARKQAEFGKR